MITLTKILKSEFADADIVSIVEILRSHNLLQPIKKSLSLINRKIKAFNLNDPKVLCPQVNHIATSLLIIINEHLRLLKEDKRTSDIESLEYLCGSVFRKCFVLTLKKIPEQYKSSFSKDLYCSLKDACYINKYNFNMLLQILSITESANETIASQSGDAIKKIDLKTVDKIPGYVWEGKLNNENKLFDLFDKFNICNPSEKKKFSCLFNDPSNNLCIKMNNVLALFILQFFYHLKKTGLITYHGCRGFYQVLQFHVIDFDSLILRSKTPQRAIDAAKNHHSWKANYELLQEAFMDIH